MGVGRLTEDAEIGEGVKAPTGVGEDVVHGPEKVTAFLCIAVDDKTELVQSILPWVKARYRDGGLHWQKELVEQGKRSHHSPHFQHICKRTHESILNISPSLFKLRILPGRV